MAALVKDITMSIVPFSENKQIAIIITIPIYFTEDNDNEKEELKIVLIKEQLLII